MQPQMIAGEGHEHGAHAEVQPAGSVQHGHTGIDEGDTGMGLGPGLEQAGIEFGLAHPVVAAMEIAELDIRLILELLDEVAVPVQPRLEAFQRLRPA